MNLPPGLFQATIDSLQGQTDPQAELRDGARYRTLGSATIIPCSARAGRVPAVVAVCDISPAGIGIIHPNPMRTGEEFILAIPPNRGQGRRAALFSVVYCHPLQGGSHRIGGTFVRELRASSADDGVIEEANLPPVSGKSANSSLPASSLAQAFRQQAASGLSAEEQSQLRELEKRLAAALIN